MSIAPLDHKIINFLRKAFVPTARVAVFIVYAWFGILKIVGLSPAGPMVHQLFDATIHCMSFETFYMLFAWFEVLIGVLFLFPKAIRVVLLLLFIHMITTFLPLVFLPHITWSGFLIPTMEGQYIIKNLVIVAVAIGIAAHAHPLAHKK